MEHNTKHESLAEKGITPLDTPVSITVTSYRKRKHDPDGVSVKAVLDGLIAAAILPDDSCKEVEKVTFKSILTKGEEKTIIEIEVK